MLPVWPLEQTPQPFWFAGRGILGARGRRAKGALAVLCPPRSARAFLVNPLGVASGGLRGVLVGYVARWRRLVTYQGWPPITHQPPHLSAAADSRAEQEHHLARHTTRFAYPARGRRRGGGTR